MILPFTTVEIQQNTLRFIKLDKSDLPTFVSKQRWNY